MITGSLAGLTLVYSVDLPQIHDLERYRPSTTTDLYDQKERIIGSFALERREIVNYDDFAPVLRQAVISIEDKSFESHWGINVLRIAGSAWHDLRSHGRAQGASTLTMQLARNLFLSSERTATRKIQEAYLAIQIERAFTKEQIFTLYGNQIYLGSGMYGFEAASEFYFQQARQGSDADRGGAAGRIAQGPGGLLAAAQSGKSSAPPQSGAHRDGVGQGHHATQQAEQARNAPLGLHIAQPEMSVAPWFQEEVRQELEKRFGTEEVHEAGLRIETTLDLDLQQTANQAVVDGLATYERRRGWVGKAASWKMCSPAAVPWRTTSIPIGRSRPAPAITFMPWSPAFCRWRFMPAWARTRLLLLPEDWKWTGQRYADALVKPGDVIYVHLAEAMAGKPRAAPRWSRTPARRAR